MIYVYTTNIISIYTHVYRAVISPLTYTDMYTFTHEMCTPHT